MSLQFEQKFFAYLYTFGECPGQPVKRSLLLYGAEIKQFCGDRKNGNRDNDDRVAWAHMSHTAQLNLNTARPKLNLQFGAELICDARHRTRLPDEGRQEL
jgi:hypothetical protein